MNKFQFDTHVHLDLYNDSENIIKHINELKSYTIAVTNLPILYDKSRKNLPDTKYIRFALGLHPELIHEFPSQVTEFFSKLKKVRYVGEIGLDFSKEYTSYKIIQIEFFKRCIAECHHIGNKILSIHSRKATKEVIDIIGPEFNGKVILHWFTGNQFDTKRAINNGYYFSINNEMIKSIGGRKIIALIPLNRILLESDGPFTKTFKNKYDINFFDDLIVSISRLKQCKIEDLYEILRNNFKTLLQTDD
ncbi:Qat anti-phage system TatD family nuclease QatD [Niallia circulans]|uniref:TatD family hydrolase n=1 Tax=Niallia circulans TaxID=1397 RepID=A0A941JFR0_NIACI|nr:Qat anti-phage system TatD family nuclease QatD [Niallia circulans]MCB5237160.1 TatD family hydrolase [Niallia circulans]